MIGPVETSLRCEAVSPEPLEVFSLRGVEALDTPHVFELNVRLPDADTDATLLFEQDAILSLQRREAGATVVERSIGGLCFEVEELGVEDGHALARVVLRPAIAYGELGRRTRVFQDMTATEILERVLEELLAPFGRAVQNDVRRETATREYCVQYAETDLAFVSRLMEEEGINYAFGFDGQVEVLILRDASPDFSSIETTDGVVPYEAHATGVTSAESIFALSRTDRTRPTATATRDRDWTSSGLFVEHAIEGEDAFGRVREIYEHDARGSVIHGGYDAGVGRYQENDLEPRTALRREEQALDAQIHDGAGRAVGFAPGVNVTVAGHPDPMLDAGYTLRRVEHFGGRAHGEERPGEPGSYHNRFEAFPEGTPYRPPRVTPKPTVPGAQTATVTGPAGEEIHVDEHGRVRIQFDWDRDGADDETSTCWVRCAEAWAGAGWGALYHPRIGMEVLVSFVDGDPDRPLITGCLYNGVNVPPYSLPDEKTKSTVKSNSSLGGGGFNELRFEDRAGEEQVFLHAQKDLNEVVLNDHSTSVGGDQENVVGNDQTQEVGNDQSEEVHGNQTMTVGGDRTVTVDESFEELVVGGEKRSVKSHSKETILDGETHLTVGSTRETITSGEKRFVAGGFTETIIGDVNQVVTGPSTHMVTSTQDVIALAGVELFTPSAMMLTVAGNATFTGMGGGTITSPASTLVMATTIKRADGFWDFLSPMSTSTVGTSLDMSGVKMQGGIVAAGAGGAKFELKQVAIGRTQLKAAAVGVNVDLWLLDLDNDGTKPDGFGCYLWLP